jgi:DNA-directed RNA polymerase specialized sigma24 family protein
MGSPRFVRLLIPTGEQAMADEAQARPLTGSPPERLKLGGLRALRGGGAPGHDFNDPWLHGRMKRECRRIYTRAFGAISDSDWDAAFNFAYGQAWKVEREKGSIDSLTAWLTTAAHNAVISEHRKTGRVDLLATEEFFTQPVLTDLADTVEDRQILRDAIFCLKSTLPERARLVWTLRFAGDYEPGEIQRHLKISKKAYEKDLELASRLVVDQLQTARESGVCNTPDMSSMVRAYAIWGEEHGAERAKLAREHLDRCPACRHTVRVLRSAQRAAAFLPPPILGLTSQHSPALGVVLQTTESVAARIQDGLWRLTDRVQDGLLRMKYGLMKIVSRGPASGPVGADRTATVLGAGGTSGAALATKAVVGCIAAGVLASGTGACLKAAGVGVPGLGGLIHAITGSPHHRLDGSRSRGDYWTAPAENFSAVPSASALQSVLIRPARTVIPTNHRRTIRKPDARALSSTVAARSDFGSGTTSTPQPNQAEVRAARNEFSTSSHLARSASTDGTATAAQSPPPSELHTSKASTKAAENEFEGP